MTLSSQSRTALVAFSLRGYNLQNLLVWVGVILFLAFGIFQVVIGYQGIEYHLGAGWAIAAIVAAFCFRFMLPITIGTYFGVVDVLEWHWFVGLLIAVPGLMFMAPSIALTILAPIAAIFGGKQKKIPSGNKALIKKSKRIVLEHIFKICSLFHGEHKLTCNVVTQNLKTSLKIHKKIANDIQAGASIKSGLFNDDAVFVEILLFMTCFSQAAVKRNFHELWDVPAFKKNLQEPVMRTGPYTVERIISSNYYDLLQSPSSIYITRISEYFKQDGIDKFISNLLGVVVERKLLPEYNSQENPETQKLKEVFRNGLGKILADHDLAITNITGKSA